MSNVVTVLGYLLDGLCKAVQDDESRGGIDISAGLLGKEPPKFMLEVATDGYLNNFSDKQDEELVEWALSSNTPWVTGQGLIDAAVILVRDAADNGNIVEG